MTEKNESGLSPEETAFFESGGETEVTEVTPETIETDAADAGASEEGAKQTDKPTKDAEKTDVGKKDKDAAEGADDKKSPTVPHAVFHAEREDHKKTKAQLDELRAFKAVMEERWNAVQTQEQQKQQKDADPEPNIEEDFIGHQAWLGRQFKALNEAQARQAEQVQQQTQAQQADQAVWDHWNQETARYQGENPDFQNAAKWLAETRNQQLAAIGNIDQRMSSQRARDQQINAELKQIIIAAAQQGRSPAEVVYQFAQSYGYKPQGAENKDETAEETAARLKALEEAQNGSRTVGQAAGKAGGDEVSPESLAAMSESEFAAWMAAPGNERKFRQMMA